MGIIKDFIEYGDGYQLRYQLINAVNPKVWLRLHKRRKQRMNRGWSDRDTWAMGEHIAKITAEMLQHLLDNSYIDWEVWFEQHNKKELYSYTNLQSAIDDINNYLSFLETDWSEGLDVTDMDATLKKVEKTEDGFYQFFDLSWTDKATGKILTDKEINKLIKQHHDKEIKLYKEATRAMKFFGGNFASFWD